jgi:ribosomal protein S18 acetylase RimI-like enzyme
MGFLTLASCEIRADKLPRKFAKKYPYIAPAAKLARLAVAKKRQRQGLGTHMIINAIERIITVSENLGIISFFVDAKNKDAKAYYEQFGFIKLPDNPLALFLPLATLRQAYETILGV